MRKLIGFTLTLAITFAFIFSGCETQKTPAPTAYDDGQMWTEESTIQETANSATPASTESITQSSFDKNKSAQPSNTNKNTVILSAGNSTFSVVLYDNDTAAALRKHLPLSVTMSELHGNEKYDYLPYSLPTDSKNVRTIKAGDLMLYGSDCLVLFYDSFSTSYSYTRLGYIEDVTGLKDALGNGSVQITIK